MPFGPVNAPTVYITLMLQSPSDSFMNFVQVNIGLIIEDVHLQRQQLQRLWGYFPSMVEHFDELVQQIISGQRILAVSDGSYLEDGQASVGWALYEPCEECDNQGRVVPSVKVLFGSTILVDGRLDSNNAYRMEAVGIFTVTIILHFLGLFLEQQQIATSLICD